ncbi:hypothetical protein ACQP0U_00825 [Micromonospora sp. CA-269861]|uniref:hypothetical protein n=1 Tax=Micromonospora sp. CA-269861 TaxID=3239968 RepID=UPI003D9002E3
MDENADRAQVPGQQPVPERDVEPLWPPDPGDRGAVPPWAAVAEQRGGPSSVAPPVTPPVAAPPIGRPPVPGQPGAAAQSPPSPSDYPSLTGAVPPPGVGPQRPVRHRVGLGAGAAELATTDRPGRRVTAARSASDRCPADASGSGPRQQRRADWRHLPRCRCDTRRRLRAEGRPTRRGRRGRCGTRRGQQGRRSDAARRPGSDSADHPGRR